MVFDGMSQWMVEVFEHDWVSDEELD